MKGQKVRAALAPREPVPREAPRPGSTPGGEQAFAHGVVLKEQFGQLWSYRAEGGAYRLLHALVRRAPLTAAGPFEKFADLVANNWEGIAAYCVPGNKVALDFVEGLNNKIRVIQRRCYGLRDEDYLHLKILTWTLPRSDAPLATG